jgi:CubicO group peptidase (beta-lactamase class C family)
MPYSKYFLSSELKIPADADLNQKIELINEWLEKLHNEGKFNGAVLVAKEGKILFDKTYGYTNVERKTRLTNQSSFDLASVSKQFTAMTIMILVEQGKLNYDDPINKYLPELNYPDITIRHLLHHTSGLEDFEYLADEYYNENKSFRFYKSPIIQKNEEEVDL